jgi:23S rRNA (guanosine2251-2'-O)-methyltransferase
MAERSGGRRRARGVPAPPVRRGQGRGGRPVSAAWPRPARRPETGIGGEQVEGLHSVRELLVAGRRRVREVLVSDSVLERGAVEELAELADAARARLRVVTPGRLAAVAGTSAPQGVVALAEPLPVADLDEVVRRARRRAEPLLVVVADGITDPMNLGSLARSALGAGAHALVLPRHRSARFSPAATKAAVGAIEHLPVALAPGVPALLARLGADAVVRVGLDPAGPVVLWDLELGSVDVALVVGGEGRGLGELVRRRVDHLASLPELGPPLSLNAGVATAVAAFEVARQRRAARLGAPHPPVEP